MAAQPIQTDDFKSVLAFLKKVLKQRKVTYAQLARRMAMSESTLKKMFIAADWSYGRLAEVCAALDLDLVDVLTAAKERRVTDIRFSAKQEELFAGQPLAFAAYWLLVYERLASEVVQARLQLKTTDYFRILRTLDTHGLIALHPGDVVKVPSLRPVQWSSTGPFVTKLKQKWSQTVVADAATGNADRGGQLLVQYFQLHPDSFDKLTAAVADLEREFAKRTARDMALYGDQVVKVRFSLAMARGSFLKEADDHR